jgi:hypothetical protein
MGLDLEMDRTNWFQDGYTIRRCSSRCQAYNAYCMATFEIWKQQRNR